MHAYFWTFRKSIAVPTLIRAYLLEKYGELNSRSYTFIRNWRVFKKIEIFDENFLTWGLFHIISLWHYEYCWNERDTTSYYGNIKLETRFIGGASLAGFLGGSYRGRAPATFMTASPWFFGLFPPGKPWRWPFSALKVPNIVGIWSNLVYFQLPGKAYGSSRNYIFPSLFQTFLLLLFFVLSSDSTLLSTVFGLLRIAVYCT